MCFRLLLLVVCQDLVDYSAWGSGAVSDWIADLVMHAVFWEPLLVSAGLYCTIYYVRTFHSKYCVMILMIRYMSNSQDHSTPACNSNTVNQVINNVLSKLIDDHDHQPARSSSCDRAITNSSTNPICSLAVNRQVSATTYIRDVRGSSRRIMVSHDQYDEKSTPPPGTDSYW